MIFKVSLMTSGFAKRELEIEATSVQDAINQAKNTYKKCEITDIDLIPKEGYVRLYSNGEQLEVPISNIYIPFE